MLYVKSWSISLKILKRTPEWVLVKTFRENVAYHVGTTIGLLSLAREQSLYI